MSLIPVARKWLTVENLIPYNMNNLFRGLIAGYGAKKLGGGCLGSIVVFVIIWMLLGQCQ
jgi:hypothetical protein